jgi:putative membrane protein
MGHNEMAALEIGLTKADDQQLKSMTQQFQSDHQKMSEELKALAQRKGVSIADEESEKPNHHIRKLSTQSGNEFKKEYVDQMVEDHEDTVKLFEKAATDSKDSEVREFAGKYLPTLRDHLNQVRTFKQSQTGR